MNLKIILFAATMLAGSRYAGAQTLNIAEGQVTYSFPAEITGEMIFGNDGSLTITGREFILGESTEMWVDERETESNVVSVVYDNNTAHVSISGNIARYIETEVNGAHVTVTQSSEVSASNCGEITYRLAGNSADGSFNLTGSYKSTIE
ncbi:MAG: hypothetical protein K2J29_00965, partial [Muribaculaceae bacterium]|nr:hypothetical protein [Muribaculaceae bacterium]